MCWGRTESSAGIEIFRKGCAPCRLRGIAKRALLRERERDRQREREREREETDRA